MPPARRGRAALGARAAVGAFAGVSTTAEGVAAEAARRRGVVVGACSSGATEGAASMVGWGSWVAVSRRDLASPVLAGMRRVELGWRRRVDGAVSDSAAADADARSGPDGPCSSLL